MLNLFFFSTVFLFGLIVGSFLNCVIYRLEVGGNFLKGRSFCPHCKHELSWQDLIPVISFIFLRGKCRYCQKKISWQYPLVELFTGIIFLLIFNYRASIFGSGGEEEIYLFAFQFPNLVYYWVTSAFLIIVFVYDLKHYIIPDKIIYPAIIIAGIFNLQFLMLNEFSIRFAFDSNKFSNFNYSILSAILAAAFFLAIVLISRGKWMGVGDIKLAFFMGLFLGWPDILVALPSAFYIGAIAALGLIVFGKKNLKSEIPFGPFLVAGTFLALFRGNELINWYQSLFLVK